MQVSDKFLRYKTVCFHGILYDILACLKVGWAQDRTSQKRQKDEGVRQVRVLVIDCMENTKNVQ